MRLSFGKWAWSAFVVTLVTMLVLGLLRLFNLQVGSIVLWFSCIATYWVLSCLAILPWDVYFSACETLDKILACEQKGGKVVADNITFVLKAKKRSLIISIFLHIVVASVFCGLALWEPLYYYAAIAAMFLVFLRPGIRAVEHITAKLYQIRYEIKFPEDDVWELKDRLGRIELNEKEFKAGMDHIGKTKEQVIKAIEDVREQYLKVRTFELDERMRNIEVAHELIRTEVLTKIDTFNDASAFKSAWDRIFGDLAKKLK